nr:Gx transporter family protein [bacterium]
MKPAVQRLTRLALIAACALAAHTVESWLPPLFPALPGARLGLSNIFVLFALLSDGWGGAFAVTLIKCLGGALFSGSTMGLMYSLGGSLAALAIMLPMRRMKFGVPGISVAGAVAHQCGQVAVAWLVWNTPGALSLLPGLWLVAVPTGFAMGLLAEMLYNRLKRLIG